MLEIELLHVHHGDKKKKIDTSKPEGVNEVERLFKNLCKQKCAIFLERGKKTYRVIGYEAKTDKLIVETGVGKRVKTSTMTTAEASRAICRVSAADAKVAAVAPVAGGCDGYRPR